ncbi:MAG TPA: glycosyltransferase [Edaphobacter sp.]|nr:glycosyltransferase [Edaphobacter sp.]
MPDVAASSLILASVIIPTYNGGRRIAHCLDALLPQIGGRDIEIIVIDDGSTDDTCSVVQNYPAVRLITQANAGPAAARNHGASAAKGKILLFTDDDCVPMPDWMDAMLAPFQDPKVVGVKGIYRTHQKSLAARFVQMEYEDKYRLMANLPSIDFIDTYSAGFLRDRFLEMNGYDTSFPVACAEDIELSYRMSSRGWLMKFVPQAIVYHTHPATFSSYLRKKYKFAFWRILAVRKNPAKGVKDSHTPQLMKLQLLFVPALLGSILLDVLTGWRIHLSMLVIVAFLLSTLPFALRALKKDPVVGVLSPLLLAARSFAQLLGVASGTAYVARHSRQEAASAR